MARRAKGAAPTPGRRSNVVADNENVILFADRKTHTSRKTGISKTRDQITFVWNDLVTFAPYFDAVWLLDQVSTDVLMDVSNDIQAGLVPGSNTAQEPLSPNTQQWAEAKKGTRPNVRGWTNNGPKSFPLNIWRRKINASGKVVRIGHGRQGTKASTSIIPDGMHSAWVAREFARGVDYFTVDEAVVSASVDRWVSFAMEGAPAAEPSAEDLRSGQ